VIVTIGVSWETKLWIASVLDLRHQVDHAQLDFFDLGHARILPDFSAFPN
jgi:hypothetical protein